MHRAARFGSGKTVLRKAYHDARYPFRLLLPLTPVEEEDTG
jgi:hypothetical protein